MLFVVLSQLMFKVGLLLCLLGNNQAVFVA